MFMGKTKNDLQMSGLDAMNRASSCRKTVIASLAFVLLFLTTSVAFAEGGFGQAFDDASSEGLGGFTCALRGTLGWILIGTGALLAIWDYFVQKQGHILIIAFIGILAVFILGRAMPEPDGGCD